MPVECGTVLETRGTHVLLSASPNASCGSCMARGTCLMGGDGKERRLWVRNTLEARPGDSVEFIIGPGAVIKTSALFYFLPVVLLTAGIAFGVEIHESVGMESESAGAVFGMIGLTVSFLLIKLVSGLWQERRAFEPVMVRILEGGGH